ncbi:MAG TPA: hypothetical protein VHT05_06750 [Candidatus Elarobacter sp.]|nr:hypothetical protein [Candidatus Elarobacter sp.]
MRDGGSPDELRQRAANAYAVWPLAALDLFREPADATAWSRLHVRQAFVFGIIAAFGYLLLLALPLIVLIVVPPLAASTVAVVWLYALGLLADLIGAIVLLRLALSFRERALRGELFAVRGVTPLAQRLFPIER